jgi:hypothetical protein
LAFVFVLHFPFVNGKTIANVTVMFAVPVIPAYAFVPLTIGTGSVTTNVAQHVVVVNVVGCALLLLFSSLPSCVVLRRMVPFFKISSL